MYVQEGLGEILGSLSHPLTLSLLLFPGSDISARQWRERAKHSASTVEHARKHTRTRAHAGAGDRPRAHTPPTADRGKHETHRFRAVSMARDRFCFSESGNSPAGASPRAWARPSLALPVLIGAWPSPAALSAPEDAVLSPTAWPGEGASRPGVALAGSSGLAALSASPRPPTGSKSWIGSMTTSTASLHSHSGLSGGLSEVYVRSV